MPDPLQLPHLLHLLEDDSPMVQDAVLRELASFGDRLEPELSKIDLSPYAGQLDRLQELQRRQRMARLLDEWSDWFDLEDACDRLETALGMVAGYMDPTMREGRLAELLDGLARDFKATGAPQDAYRLARYLFRERGLSGATEDYYNPQHSNLIHVIENGPGIPISLACVYMLVGNRLGLRIEGCNFPGHFLARTVVYNEAFLVDCFNGGKMIPARSFSHARLGHVATGGAAIEMTASVPIIVARVLGNLANSYGILGDKRHRDLMNALLARLRAAFDDEEW